MQRSFKIAKNRNTYAKRQREADKRQRADDKRNKREQKRTEPGSAVPPRDPRDDFKDAPSA